MEGRMTVKTTVSFSEDQDALIERLIASGRYPSRSAVFQAGLERLRRDIEDEEIEREALKTLLAERRAETPITSAEMDGRLEALFADAARRHGLAG
jgi:antitoxin ParD1/3/4